MARTYVSLNVHIIFSTKHRAPMIEETWRDDLHAYVGGTVRGLGGLALAVGGTADHIHALTKLRSDQSVADLVREVKKASSVWSAERYRAFRWQEGYAAFTVSPLHIDRVVEYIQSQEEHHKRLSSADELRALLIEAGIEVNEQYFE